MSDTSTTARGIDAETLAALPSMELRARTIVDGYYSGQHRSPYRGASVEFADHRQYTHGDELRHLDWRLYARSDRFFVKQFEAETNLALYLVVDASASMNYPERGVRKLDCASYLAAALGYLAFRQRDAVGLTVLDDAIRDKLPPRTRRGHLQAVFDRLEATEAGGETALGDVLTQFGATLPRRGLVVLLSDLLDDSEHVLRALSILRRRGNDVIVLQVLDRSELELDLHGPYVLEDLETGERLATDTDAVREEYHSAIRRHVNGLHDGCVRHGIDHELIVTDMPLGRALIAYLARRRRRTG